MQTQARPNPRMEMACEHDSQPGEDAIRNWYFMGESALSVKPLVVQPCTSDDHLSTNIYLVPSVLDGENIKCWVHLKEGWILKEVKKEGQSD